MARKLRVEVEGGLYHLIARGNDRQDIFHSHEDRERFLALLLKEKVLFAVLSVCLLFVLISAVATVFGLPEDKFCDPEKSAKAVLAKEVLILIARERGAAGTELSLIAGLDTSNISRRHDAAREKLQTDRKLAYARDQVEKLCLANIAESQT
jgi:hypothetical protein